MSDVAGRLALLGARALVVAALLAPLWVWDGGLIEHEALAFVRQYLDDRPVLAKVFDPHANDIGTYQARELSYFIDYLDAQALARWLGGGYLLFVPASGVVAGVLTAAVFLRARRHYVSTAPLTATLLLLVYLTGFVYLVTAGIFYRSTKPMLAPVVMATAFYVLRYVRNAAPGETPGREPRRDVPGEGPVRSRGSVVPVAVFGLFSLMSLLDRQGFFLAGLGAVVLVIDALLRRRGWAVAIAGAAAVATMTVYNLVVAPALVLAINGYVPSFEYQQVAMRELLTTPSYYLRAGEVLLQATQAMMGSLPAWLCVLLLAWLVWGAFRRDAHGLPRRLVAGLLLLLVAGAQVVMFGIMIARHPAVYDLVDHRLWYYPLPFQALLLVGAMALLDPAIRGWTPRKVAALNVALVVLIVANIARWDDYQQTMMRSRWFPSVYYQSQTLKASLRDGRPRPYLDPDYYDFYELCLSISPVLRARAAQSVARLPPERGRTP